MNYVSTRKDEIIRATYTNSKLEILEVKQIAELENKFKNECKVALNAYRSWKKQYQDETDVIELLYGQLKGIILRKHAENAVQAYWIVRSDFRMIFKRYLAAHSTHYRASQIKKQA